MYCSIRQQQASRAVPRCQGKRIPAKADRFGCALSLCALCLGLLFATGVIAAKKAEKKEADLQQIKARIESVRKTIQADTTKRDALLGQLENADLQIQSAREQSSEIRQRRVDSERKLAELEHERVEIEQKNHQQRAALASELRLAYMNGQEEQLKLLLNQQDPVELGRMLAYYGYFGRARADRIAAIRDHLNHLELIAADAATETQRLREIEQQQRLQVTRLAQARQQRAQTLTAIQTKIRARGAELTNLQREAATLEKLLEELRRASEDFPLLSPQPFGKLQGKLPWPAKGKITARFNQLRAGGPLRWQGIVIDTEPSTQVRAPFHGRVVYADWLAGLGLLVVLDHGGGYLSLYGHNEQIYRKVGDVVAPGDALGIVSEKADGAAELYFEIRKGKQPLDPQQWLRRSQ